MDAALKSLSYRLTETDHQGMDPTAKAVPAPLNGMRNDNSRPVEA
ncbi:GTP cyclohydrolase I FolE, partial [Methylobacterium sp. WL19]